MSSVIPGENAEVLDLIDLFVQQLQRSNGADRQLKAALEMVRAATHADVVFVYDSTNRQVADWAGPDILDADRYAVATRRILAEVSNGESRWLSVAVPAFPGVPETPGSAAMIRLSRSRGLWVVALRGRKDGLLSEQDLKLMGVARRLLVQQQQAQEGQDRLREMLFGLVRCLTASLDARDPYTWGHSERVARIAVRMAEQMRLAEAVRSELYLGGLLHDVGKIGVPDEILRKPERLTTEEFEQVKLHTVIGDGILVHVTQLAHLRPLVRNHHERYDGGGYPDGLAGEKIPLGARILAIADSCDAMMSDRPYRKGMPVARIEKILREGAGVQWDPRLVEVFMACKEDAFTIIQRGLGESVFRAVDHALKTGPGSPLVAASALRASAQG